MTTAERKTRAVVITAHPDDEILWAGGWILAHPNWEWFIFSLCRASDPDRAPKFFRILDQLGATGSIADLEDGPEQSPLNLEEVEKAIIKGVPNASYDYCFTHGPEGEYTHHLRHEEVSRAVQSLWIQRDLNFTHLWMFAYQDEQRKILPQAIEDAHQIIPLPQKIWEKKYWLITQVYGFSPDSWEARATPTQEAFWCFDKQADLEHWLQQREYIE